MATWRKKEGFFGPFRYFLGQSEEGLERFSTREDFLKRSNGELGDWEDWGGSLSDVFILKQNRHLKKKKIKR